MGGGDSANTKCGLAEYLIFIAAIITGTACSICSKTMMELTGTGITGEEEVFRKPIFQTFGMFVGMCFGLVMHWFVLAFKIPFPGYSHAQTSAGSSSLASNGGGNSTNYGAISNEKDPLIKNSNNDSNGNADASEQDRLPTWMYFFLAIPSIFDLGATALCMMGLQYLDVSIYQLLRGSGIIFVALMKQHVLGDHLYTFQWMGIFWNVVSVFMVGGTAILNEGESGSDIEESSSKQSGEALLGVVLVMSGALVQAMQFVFEEKVMTMDIPSPPLLLIGMEGFWGTLLCVFVVYPLAYYLPGDDHGSYEDPFNTWAMFVNTHSIKLMFIVYFFAILGYNMFAVLVTYMLNSVWHAILDNFRPITVWGTDLFIFYMITSSGDFGEPWTKWSFVQLGGMFVLLYGTAIYNAPNGGSILLKGQWYAFGYDLSHEYDEILQEEEEKELDEEWEGKMESFKSRRPSSMYGEHSPHISIHTQYLRGVGTPKI